MTGADVADVLGRYRLRDGNEQQLQEAIAAALTEAGVEPEREVILTPADRIDLMLPGGVGIEVKIAGGYGSVARQLRRYATCPKITELVLVTTRLQHTPIANLAFGKPLYVVPILSGLL